MKATRNNQEKYKFQFINVTPVNVSNVNSTELK